MFYKREGFPEEGELLLVTVTKIQYSSVFVHIDEYDNAGMIHISEIAAGRIRNIRDYVKEGKKVVTKVLRVNEQRGHVDLSLRRVTDSQRRKKVDEIKQEQKAESIIGYIAKQNSMSPKSLYDKLASKILKDYIYVHHAFMDVVEGNFDLEKVVDDKIAKQLEELVVQRFKPKPIEIAGNLTLSTHNSEGVEIIKEALKKADEGKGVSIRYLGGGKYRVIVNAKDYKVAEPIIKEATKKAIQYVEKHDGKGNFERVE